MDKATGAVTSASELLELAESENDEGMAAEIERDAGKLESDVRKLEFQRMFRGEMDSHNAFVDIQAGAGGTEAQDWAEMLLRMYLRWAVARGFDAELMDSQAGEVAGIKSATIAIKGEYAYGWLKTEIGVHRLVRKSPFDSDNRRHTSFTSVFVSPEVDDDIEIDINPADLRTDVYRSSGAGGQHVNKTESAVRITHIPTSIVVACQTERSQHENRATAMKMLKAKLYELEVQKRNASVESAGSHQVRHRLGQPDPQLRARPAPHQGPAHRRRDAATRRRCSTAISTSSWKLSLKAGLCSDDPKTTAEREPDSTRAKEAAAKRSPRCASRRSRRDAVATRVSATNSRRARRSRRRLLAAE